MESSNQTISCYEERLLTRSAAYQIYLWLLVGDGAAPFGPFFEFAKIFSARGPFAPEVRLSMAQPYGGEKIIAEKSPANLGRLCHSPDLAGLHLMQFNVSHGQLLALSSLRTLTSLQLSHCHFDNDDVGMLLHMPQLEFLQLAECPVFEETLSTIAQLKRLRAVDLSDTSICDDGLARLRELPQLTHLSIRATMVSNSGLRQLQAMPQLRRLEVGEKQFSNEAVESLRIANPKLVVDIRKIR